MISLRLHQSDTAINSYRVCRVERQIGKVSSIVSLYLCAISTAKQRTPPTLRVGDSKSTRDLVRKFVEKDPTLAEKLRSSNMAMGVTMQTVE